MSDPSHTYFIAKLRVVLRFSFCVFHASLKTVTWKACSFTGGISQERAQQGMALAGPLVSRMLSWPVRRSPQRFWLPHLQARSWYYVFSSTKHSEEKHSLNFHLTFLF